MRYNANIYADRCVYRFILACIWCPPASLIPPARKITHNSKGAMQKCQIQVQHWPDITGLSISITS